MWKIEQAMTMTETAGAWLADLDRALNAIRYNPTICTEDDLEDLEKINQMLKLATRLAEKIAEF